MEVFSILKYFEFGGGLSVANSRVPEPSVKLQVKSEIFAKKKKILLKEKILGKERSTNQPSLIRYGLTVYYIC